jgi:cephalosporin-C deacetylase
LEKARLEGARYYDGVNFARRITVSGWYSFGYNDEVVPPTSSYGLYNSVKAPKTLSLYQMTGHYWYQEQWDEWQAWIIQQLKK